MPDKLAKTLTWKDINIILNIHANMIDEGEVPYPGLEEAWCKQILKIFNLKKGNE